LHRATGKRLWLAKADALIAACLQAHDPASGLFNIDLAPEYRGGTKHFAYGGYLRNLCEYAVLRADIQPPFKVAETHDEDRNPSTAREDRPEGRKEGTR
jgi:hypothetical protein